MTRVWLLIFAAISTQASLAATVPGHPVTPAWDSAAAARYMDYRQNWWMAWKPAQRDHNTACISCHTAVPYALARPVLRKTLGETHPSAPEQQMLAYILKRVTLWDQVQPFYTDEQDGPGKTPESRGTEAVLNALVLARYDAASSHLGVGTRKAFENMWAEQLSSKAGGDSGSWNWLNFEEAPWESSISHYYGATLAAIAVGLAPDHYSGTPSIQPHLQQLTTYLTRHYDAQPLVNRIVLLWASTRLPALLPFTERNRLLNDIRATQQKDGGWSLSNLGRWKRTDGTLIDQRSDGYATGLTVYALEQNGISSHTPELQKALQWLTANQDIQQGLWPAYSLNKQRDNTSDVGRFMSDAATSYSVLALDAARHQPD